MNNRLSIFIDMLGADHCMPANLISADMLPKLEAALGMRLGPQLREYLLTYGYLGYKHAELFGVNRVQGLRSDMITRTHALQRLFPDTTGFAVLEDRGEDDYVLINSEDEIRRFCPARGKNIRKTSTLLNAYIMHRFSDIDLDH